VGIEWLARFIAMLAIKDLLAQCAALPFCAAPKATKALSWPFRSSNAGQDSSRSQERS